MGCAGLTFVQVFIQHGAQTRSLFCRVFKRFEKVTDAEKKSLIMEESVDK